MSRVIRATGQLQQDTRRTGSAVLGGPQPHTGTGPAISRARRRAPTDWRQGLPALKGAQVTLRDLQLSDAPSLLALVTPVEVARFISEPPTTVAGFERFIIWAHRERIAGHFACFAIVPNGCDTAVGVFQVRLLERGSATAEWGFALGSAYWGTGLFTDGARLVLEFAFHVMGLHRLEARSVAHNHRGCAALRKLGAVPEMLLRRSFVRNGESLDQILWAILAEDWRGGAAVAARTIH
jgi:RimJ/RimL family protein N-acetyltransferase